MNNMLLIDSVGYATLSINEVAGGKLKFQGKFQEANQVNKNKRMYPFDVLDSNVEKLQEMIEGRGLYGELDHPTDSIIHLANASHLITKLWWDGNVLMGEGEVLDTPSGKVLKSLIENGGRIGISSRGVGNGQVNNEGVLVIGEGYKLISFDMVCDPSTQNAFQQTIYAKKETVVHKEVKKASINENSLVSYFGCLLEQKMKETKAKLRKN
jgi:hypothetical protein